MHCHRTFSVWISPSLVSRGPARRACWVCRISVFGFSSLPAPHAGQFTWQRPHSTQVNASSTVLLPRSFTTSSPTCSFSKSRFGTLPSSGDFRNTVIGDSTRWKCFEAGMSARNTRITIMWTHQLARPASDASSRRHPSRNVTINDRDEQPDRDRFNRYFVAEPRGPDDRPTDQEVDDPGEDGDGKGRQHPPVRLKPPGIGEIDDAESPQELGHGVAAKRHEPPEHQRMRHTGEGPFGDGLALKDNVDRGSDRPGNRDDRSRTCWGRPQSGGRGLRPAPRTRQ